jgi:hypothetical protein
MVRVKGSRIACTVLAYGGLALLGLAALILVRTLAIAAVGERAEGVVVGNLWSRSGHPTARAIVRFEGDGEAVEFTSAVGTSPPLHHVDDRVTVFYWPGKPGVAVIAGFAEWYLRPMVLAGFGLVLTAMGGGFLWGPAWFARRRQRIIADGVPVQAKILAVRLDRSVKVNRRSPWVIVAEFKDEVTGQIVPCTSHYLWADPTLKYPVGSEVTVFHLQDRPDKYAFQLDKER